MFVLDTLFSVLKMKLMKNFAVVLFYAAMVVGVAQSKIQRCEQVSTQGRASKMAAKSNPYVDAAKPNPFVELTRLRPNPF